MRSAIENNVGGFRDNFQLILRLISLIAACSAVLFGILVMIGWIFNIQRLTDIFDDGISMLFNPALCTTLTGSSMLLLRQPGRPFAWRVGQLLGVIVFLFGALTLVEHFARIDLEIDTMFVNRPWGQNVTAAPMRMGVPASFSFALIGIALIQLPWSASYRRFASLLAMYSLVVCFLSFIGYWFGADTLYGIARITGIARQTSIIIMVIAVGIVAMVPDQGISAALQKQDYGGRVFRILLIPVIVIPVLLGWLRTRGEAAHAFDSDFGTALQTIGEVLAFYLILYMTTQRLSKQESEVEDAKKKLAAIVESSEDAILSVTLDGKIESWNSGAERLFGYSKQDMMGSPISRIIPPDRLSEEESILAQLLSGERVEPFETMRRRKDGSLIQASVTASLVRDAHGNIVAISKIVRDITDKKQWEDQVVESNRNKDIFLATLAHELRNPLTPIASAIGLLADDQTQSEESKTLVQMANRHLKQLICLVDELLDVSRISRGKIELHKTKCNIQEVVREALESVRHLIDDCEHTLELDLAPTPIYVDADHTRLTQVFANLINNAAKYTPNGGRLKVTTRCDNRWAVFEVADNGIGIRADEIEKAFDLFTQVDVAHDRGKTGLGVGLSLVKQLVELHDGVIELISAGKGRGTKAVVKLEAVAEAPNTDGLQSDVPSTTQTKMASSTVQRRVLVVDDMRSNTYMLTKILERQGHTVAAANDGATALQMIDDFSPDVVISDVSMPGISGYELAEELRKRYGNSLHLIAMTGYGSEADKAKSTECGFDEHLIKPPNAVILANCLDRMKPRA